MDTPLFSISVEALLNLPCSVFWKDINGAYLGCNDFGAITLGYNNGNEMLGKTDFELLPRNIAKTFRENDVTVFNEKKPIFVPEAGVLKNNFSVVFLSYKMPLYGQDHVLIGIAGIAFIHHAHGIHSTEIKNSTEINCATLSPKERLCLQYLCQGMTLKMIAKQLNISPRTVETYLERSKIKTNSQNKAQLMSIFIKTSK